MKMATSVEVKERPILFRGPMVRAILSGKKTQTRRVMKPQPDGFNHGVPYVYAGVGEEKVIHCPYGNVGDRLWVRETWQEVPIGRHRDWPGIPDGRPRKPSINNPACAIIYRADGEFPGPEIWRPSIFMPRWASRLEVDITNRRAEPLNEISDEDAMAEGITETGETGDQFKFTWYGVEKNFALEPAKAFSVLWDSVREPGSWDLNPFVWVVTFKRLEAE
jgi:hypothetical protein